MELTVATWNINSVRLRAPIVMRFLGEEAPDILCLQETKTPDEKFPAEAFDALGYVHRAIRGDKGYNGVAIVSRIPLAAVDHVDFCGRGDARHVAAGLPGGAVVHNLYVPAGGDEPDPKANPKFAHKLDFMAELRDWGAGLAGGHIAVGDINIAPLPEDVWSHRQLLGVVSHTPVEVEAFAAAQAAGGWRDVVRADVPVPAKLYSWWSYRARDWSTSDRGRRLDHIWIRGGVGHVPGSARIRRDVRGWERPSDHAPVLARVTI